MEKDLFEYLKPEQYDGAFASRKKMRIDSVNPESVFGIIEPSYEDSVYSSIIKLDDDFITKTSSGLYLLYGVEGPIFHYKIGENDGMFDYSEVLVPETMKRHDIKKRHFGWGKKWVGDAIDETYKYLRSQLVEEIKTNPFSEKFKNHMAKSYNLRNLTSRVYTKNHELEFLMK